MESNTKTSATRARRVWIALIAIVVLLGVFVVWKSARVSGTMSAADVSDEGRFVQTAAGTKTRIVMEIGESTADGTIRGKLLQMKSEEVYVRTTTPVTVRSNAQTKVVMGKQIDIHSGAVVHIAGTVRDDHSIQAEQLVILTGYVQVQ